MIKLRKNIEEAWLRTVREVVRWPRRHGKVPPGISDIDFVESVASSYRFEMSDMWETYTKNRSELSRRVLSDRKNLATYMLGFHLPNAARFNVLLQRLQSRHQTLVALRDFKGLVNIVDIGCGTGALSQVFCGELSPALGKRLSFYLQDALDGAVQLAQDGLQTMGHDGPIHYVKGRIEERVLPRILQPATEPDAWILTFGYVWNELARNPKAKEAMQSIFSKLVNHPKPVLLLFVEPSNQIAARGQMELRDWIVEQGYVALYPCPHQMSCPMLERSRDWCYSEEIWQLPRTQMKIDRLMEVNRKHLTSAAYAFASPAWMKEFGGDNSKIEPMATVVGKPLDEKKSFRRSGPPEAEPSDGSLLLCGTDGKLSKRPLPGAQLHRMQRGYQVYEQTKPATSARPRSKTKS